MSSLRPFFYGLFAASIGVVLALPSVMTSWPWGIFSQGLAYMSIFFHEIGHTVFSWIFGMPAIPIFDFKHGGGYSVPVTSRVWAGQIAIWVAFAYWLYSLRERLHPIALYPLAGLLLVMVGVGLTPYFEDVILFMGHGTEAIIGGFLIARGIHGVLLTRPSERWLNVTVGTFFIFEQLVMCLMLLTDAQTRYDYETQKGGHGMGDLTRIAGSHIGWTQDGMVAFLAVFTVVMAILIPIIIYILLRIFSPRYSGKQI